MKLLHTADIHLGAKTYGRRDPETGLNTRLLDVRRSFEGLVQRALDADVDAFLFSGDAYHTADPTPTQQKIFAECLQPLADADVPLVLIIGNHDHPVTYGRASSLDIFEYVDGDVYCYRKPTASVQVIDTKSGPLQLIPLPWPIRSQILTKDEYRSMGPEELRQFIEETYVNYVHRRAEEVQNEEMGQWADGTEHQLSPNVPTVLAGHVTVQGAELSGSERTTLISSEPKFTVGQLAVAPIHYVALGHIHRAQNRNPEGQPPVVYAGSIERVTFTERDEKKGFYLVDVEPERDPATYVTFEETPARAFVALHVDARDAEEPTERILETIEQADVADAVVRVRYHVEEAQLSLVDQDRLRAALDEADTIAAIERTVDPAERKRRTVVTRESDLEEAVRQYVGQHDDLEGMEEDLVNAALELEAELEAEGKTAQSS
ncbi:exonuclease sbcCD subunit D [Salinibacter sp. 10B]|uniref:metallophosphoesterase family protein n=1 Tax=Salinibacter sp. 10B TaxID=1923971 RepID=UPI000CF4A363|nr:exonuclease SbcCD subunit D [Salinibacter sp. 10B]PQJ36158.1 exonuclease sbcCD subunit D [Salinibacter sp. 10B]